MEEKNLIELPDKVADYIEYMKENNYTLKGALNVIIGQGETKKFMDNYLEYGSNQEKFALAWLNGYKRKKKFYRVRFKNMADECDYYLNYNKKEENLLFGSNTETSIYKTKFTKEFLEENGFGWVLTCEGVELIEVEND